MASKGHGGLGKGLGALLKNREITPAKDQVQEIAASEIQATTANTAAVSAASRERVSSVPSPEPPITISPTTAPVMASTSPPRTPARTAGAAIGSSMCQRRCQTPAPSSSECSITRMSSPRKPTMVVVTMGKNATMAHNTAIGTVP